MPQWTAKVHKSGSKIRLFNDGKPFRTIEAGVNTFAPAEAQNFAKLIVSNLQKESDHDAQARRPDSMLTGDASGEQVNGKPSPTLPEDIFKNSSIEELNQRIGSLQGQIKEYQNREVEAVKEDRAKRAFRIAKTLVARGQLKDDDDIIKSEAIKIANLSDDEIIRLERLANNEPEFTDVEEAKKVASLYRLQSIKHHKIATDFMNEDKQEQAIEYESMSREADENAMAIDEKIVDLEKYDMGGPNAEYMSEIGPELEPEEVGEPEEELFVKEKLSSADEHSKKAENLVIKAKEIQSQVDSHLDNASKAQKGGNNKVASKEAKSAEQLEKEADSVLKEATYQLQRTADDNLDLMERAASQGDRKAAEEYAALAEAAEMAASEIQDMGDEEEVQDCGGAMIEVENDDEMQLQSKKLLIDNYRKLAGLHTKAAREAMKGGDHQAAQDNLEQAEKIAEQLKKLSDHDVQDHPNLEKDWAEGIGADEKKSAGKGKRQKKADHDAQTRENDSMLEGNTQGVTPADKPSPHVNVQKKASEEEEEKEDMTGDEEEKNAETKKDKVRKAKLFRQLAASLRKQAEFDEGLLADDVEEEAIGADEQATALEAEIDEMPDEEGDVTDTDDVTEGDDELVDLDTGVEVEGETVTLEVPADVLEDLADLGGGDLDLTEFIVDDEDDEEELELEEAADEITASLLGKRKGALSEKTRDVLSGNTRVRKDASGRGVSDEVDDWMTPTAPAGKASEMAEVKRMADRGGVTKIAMVEENPASGGTEVNELESLWNRPPETDDSAVI